MDSDDICAPSRFSLQLQMLKDEREMALIGSQINEISLTEQLPTSRIVPCGLDEIKKFSKLRNPFNHPTVMFKKSCFIELEAMMRALNMLKIMSYGCGLFFQVLNARILINR